MAPVARTRCVDAMAPAVELVGRWPSAACGDGRGARRGAPTGTPRRRSPRPMATHRRRRAALSLATPPGRHDRQTPRRAPSTVRARSPGRDRVRRARTRPTRRGRHAAGRGRCGRAYDDCDEQAAATSAATGAPRGCGSAWCVPSRGGWAGGARWYRCDLRGDHARSRTTDGQGASGRARLARRARRSRLAAAAALLRGSSSTGAARSTRCRPRRATPSTTASSSGCGRRRTSSLPEQGPCDCVPFHDGCRG